MSLDTMYHHLWKHNVSDVSLLHRRWEPLSNKHVSFLRYFLAKEVRGFAYFLALLQPKARLIPNQPWLRSHPLWIRRSLFSL
jgi:hypothetical protein